MIFCPLCKIEMPCVQNEVAVIFGEAHVYMGDAFACPECRREIISTGDPFHMPKVRQIAKRFIEAKE